MTKAKLILIPVIAALAIAPFTSSFAEDAAQEQAKAAATEAAKTGEAVKTEEAKKEEVPPQQQTATVQDPEKMKAYEKAVGRAKTTLEEIGKDLKEESAKHFFVMYQNYNLIGTVKVVKADVGNAIQECGKTNPGMKSALDTRFKSWDEAVTPVIKEAQANVDNMIIAQDYTDPNKIKTAFSALDDARAATNASIDKRPVTTAEACQHLLDKMDDTQDNLVSLLRETLVSFGRINQNAPKSAEETAKEAKEKTSAEKLKL